MTWHKLSPAFFTLLVFLLAQSLGTVLLLIVGIAVSPEFSAALQHYAAGQTEALPSLSPLPATAFTIILMATDIVAVLGCWLVLHYIQPLRRSDFAEIRWRPASLAIAAGIPAAIATSILTEDIALPDTVKGLIEAMSCTPWGIVSIAIIGPVCEELLFREAIEGEMLRRGARPWLAVAASALAFSFVHLNLAQGLYALPMAILFGIIYLRTGNILLTSLLHILNNATAALQILIFGTDAEDITTADFFGSSNAATTVAAICILLCLIATCLFCHFYPLPARAKKNTLP